MTMPRPSAAIALVAGSLAFGALPAPAAEEAAAPPSIALELNGLDQAEAGCRMSFLAHNGMGTEISELAVEIVLFDADGRADRFLSLKTGRLPLDKTRLRQFEIDDLSCDGISRILVNDVTECTGEGLTAAGCLDALTVTSRVSVPLGL
jgi:hypothetical protein